MPVIVVTSHPHSEAERADLARRITAAAVRLVEVPPEKIQIFFWEATPGPDLIAVHAVAHRADAKGWSAAIREATAHTLEVGHTYRISVCLYPPDHTAKAGVLRPSSDHRSNARPK